MHPFGNGLTIRQINVAKSITSPYAEPSPDKKTCGDLSASLYRFLVIDRVTLHEKGVIQMTERRQFLITLPYQEREAVDNGNCVCVERS